MIDRVVAAAAGTASSFYIMAAIVAWVRFAVEKPSQTLGSRVTFDRAVAWTALSVLFAIITLVKLTSWDWNDPYVDAVLIVALLSIFVAGLSSVRAITAVQFGHRVLAVFAFVSMLVGFIILII